MNAQAYIPQLLSPEQIFEALAKHIKIEFAEINTNDWLNRTGFVGDFFI